MAHIICCFSTVQLSNRQPVDVLKQQNDTLKRHLNALEYKCF